jgi:hypothetical protein
MGPETGSPRRGSRPQRCRPLSIWPRTVTSVTRVTIPHRGGRQARRPPRRRRRFRQTRRRRQGGRQNLLAVVVDEPVVDEREEERIVLEPETPLHDQLRAVVGRAIVLAHSPPSGVVGGIVGLHVVDDPHIPAGVVAVKVTVEQAPTGVPNRDGAICQSAVAVRPHRERPPHYRCVVRWCDWDRWGGVSQEAIVNYRQFRNLAVDDRQPTRLGNDVVFARATAAVRPVRGSFGFSFHGSFGSSCGGRLNIVGHKSMQQVKG